MMESLKQALSRIPKATSILLIAASIFVLSAAVSFYIVLVKAPADLAHNTAQGIKEAFNFTPHVSIDQTVVIEQSAPILELATVARPVWIDHSWSHTWLGSTKTIQLQARFTAKAGFDLEHPFRFVISRTPLKVTAELPPAQILSMEMENYKVVRDENGWWNRISDQDREDAVKELQRLAREKAENSGILQDARRAVEERIAAMMLKSKTPVEFRTFPE